MQFSREPCSPERAFGWSLDDTLDVSGRLGQAQTLGRVAVLLCCCCYYYYYYCCCILLVHKYKYKDRTAHKGTEPSPRISSDCFDVCTKYD